MKPLLVKTQLYFAVGFYVNYKRSITLTLPFDCAVCLCFLFSKIFIILGTRFGGIPGSTESADC